MAVGVLMKSMRDGDVASAKWWLARKRKLEFGDAVDITTAGKPIVVTWDENNAD